MAKTVSVRKHRRRLGKANARWIAGVLLNDEASSDQELVSDFMRQGKMSEAEAKFYVSQRGRALRDPLHFILWDFDYMTAYV